MYKKTYEVNFPYTKRNFWNPIQYKLKFFLKLPLFSL